MSTDEGILSAEIKNYSDQELREKLTGLGMDVGPITGTTRKLYERKLIQLITGNYPQSPDEADSGSPRNSPPNSPPKPPPKSPRKSPRSVDKPKQEPVPSQNAAEEYPWRDPVKSPYEQASKDSSINVIRPRKPVPRTTVFEEPVSRRSYAPSSTPFPAANAQYRKTESNGSVMDHVIKFALFGVVMMIVVYFIVNQEPGKALEHKN